MTKILNESYPSCSIMSMSLSVAVLDEHHWVHGRGQCMHAMWKDIEVEGLEYVNLRGGLGIRQRGRSKGVPSLLPSPNHT